MRIKLPSQVGHQPHLFPRVEGSPRVDSQCLGTSRADRVELVTLVTSVPVERIVDNLAIFCINPANLVKLITKVF